MHLTKERHCSCAVRLRTSLYTDRTTFLRPSLGQATWVLPGEQRPVPRAPGRPSNRSPTKGAPPMATEVGIRELLEAGVHFGHQTRRWNPKMRRFIHGERSGIYIIDLLQTATALEKAQAFAAETARRGGTVLFVGTK